MRINVVRFHLAYLHSRNTYLFQKKNRKAVMSVFAGTIDHHNGITVETCSNCFSDMNDFTLKLDASLKKWNEENYRGVWFNVDIKHVGCIPVLSQKGFKIHHARGDKISLFLWLPKTESCKIPHYAHNMVGAGGLVINDKNQILVVRERYRSVSFWKLPGGYVDPGEEISEAAQREVLEETGIRTELVSLISFRHIPEAVFGCSDLYFVVHLKPINYEIVKQDDEIDDCQWMDVESFLSHAEVHEHVRYCVQTAIQNEKNGLLMVRKASEHPITKRAQFLYTLSHVKPS